MKKEQISGGHENIHMTHRMGKSTPNEQYKIKHRMYRINKNTYQVDITI